MANLVQLEQQLLAHDLQGADFLGILLLGQVDLAVASLANLRQDLEVALPQPRASLAEVGSLTAKVLSQGIVVLGFWRVRRRGVLRLELGQAVLAGMHVGEEVVVVVEEVWRQCQRRTRWRSRLLTQLRHIGQAFDGRLPGLLELVGGQTLRAGVVARGLVRCLRPVWLLPRLGSVGEIARLLLQTRTGVRRRVLLVRLARGAARRERRGVGEGICIVSGLVWGRGRRGLGPGGRAAHGGQQLHGILEDMGQVECAGRLVVLAGAALRRLLRADEGLLRGGTGAAHIAASSMQRWWGCWQLEAVSGVGGHDAPCLRRSRLAIVGRKARLRAAVVVVVERGETRRGTMTPKPEYRSAQLCREGLLERVLLVQCRSVQDARHVDLLMCLRGALLS
jgi:hypothetical protein